LIPKEIVGGLPRFG